MSRRPFMSVFSAFPIVWTASCTSALDNHTGQTDPPVRSPEATAPPPSATPVPEASSEEPLSASAIASAKAWTDPIMIAALARDCRFKPELENKYQPGPLLCALELDQSCVPDICFEEGESQCKPACTKSCDTCDEACATSCESCKTSCKDAACRQTCASHCGECKQTCLRQKDECASGHCGQAYADCQKNLVVEWKKGNCKSVCARTVSCANLCWKRDDAQECSAKCQKQFMGSCPTKFFPNCLFSNPPGGQ